MTLNEKLFSGGDLRTLGRSRWVIREIKTQSGFDDLFRLLFHHDRVVVMRAADAVEKITRIKPEFIIKHRRKIIRLSEAVVNSELQWHLAQLLPRLRLSRRELGKVWDLLSSWAKNKANSRIVRVHSLQALFDLVNQEKSLMQDFKLTLLQMERENIPSIKARIKILKRKSD